MKLSRNVRSERALSPSRGCAPGWSEAPSAAASAFRPPSTNCNTSQDFHGVHWTVLDSAVSAVPVAQLRPWLVRGTLTCCQRLPPAIRKLQQSHDRPVRRILCSRKAGCGLAKQQFALGRECGCYICVVLHKMQQPLRKPSCAHSSQWYPINAPLH